MSREEVAKVLKEALDQKPESLMIVYRAGDQFKTNVIAGVEAHYMRDLLSIYLHNIVAAQFRRDIPNPKEGEHVN